MFSGTYMIHVQQPQGTRTGSKRGVCGALVTNARVDTPLDILFTVHRERTNPTETRVYMPPQRDIPGNRYPKTVFFFFCYEHNFDDWVKRSAEGHFGPLQKIPLIVCGIIVGWLNRCVHEENYSRRHSMAQTKKQVSSS